VIVDRVRVRHEDRRRAGRSEFGEGQGAGAADHEVGPRVGGRHVVLERHDVRLDAGVHVGRARLVEVLRAALVPNRHRHARAAPPQHFRQRRVEALRALAAAEHEQVQRSLAAGIALRGRRHRRDRRAHRVADPFATREHVGEAGQHALRPAREQAVGDAGNAVLFVHDERHAGKLRGDPAGRCGIAAERDRAPRRLALEQRTRGRDRTDQAQRHRELGQHVLAAQAADRQCFEVQAMARHELRLEPAAGAEPDHGDLARDEFVGDREPRKDVPAGTARHDQHRPVAVRDGAHGRTSSAWRSLITCSIAFSARDTS
jgi:hypothetical protein